MTFFPHDTENKKRSSQDLKVETKILGPFFKILYCFLISQWKKSEKNKFSKVQV